LIAGGIVHVHSANGFKKKDSQTVDFAAAHSPSK
jgi:hypothetical protein